MQQGFTIWFSGFSGSGKSTISRELEKQLKERVNSNIEVLDGDEIRNELNWDLGFSKEDRITNLKRIAYITKILSRNDIIAIAAFISPYREARDHARSLNSRFLEVFINCPLEVCEERDIKGLYKKAREGEIEQFTGISDPYEEPESPDVIVSTHKTTPEECAEQIIEKAIKMNYLD